MSRIRFHPEEKLTQKEIEENQAILQAFRSRCLPIFEPLKSDLIQTHYNWYIAIEPDSGIFEIELITADGLSLATDALLDTGFSDWLAINRQDLSTRKMTLSSPQVL